MTTWTQDNTSVSYRLNPRVSEINTYDPAGNRARVQTTYQQFTFANGSRAFYDDEQLANAVHNIPEFASKFPLSAKNNVFDLAYQGNPKDPDDGGYSTYFHNIQRIFCEVLR